MSYLSFSSFLPPVLVQYLLWHLDHSISSLCMINVTVKRFLLVVALVAFPILSVNFQRYCWDSIAIEIVTCWDRHQYLIVAE